MSFIPPIFPFSPLGSKIPLLALLSNLSTFVPVDDHIIEVKGKHLQIWHRLKESLLGFSWAALYPIQFAFVSDWMESGHKIMMNSIDGPQGQSSPSFLSKFAGSCPGVNLKLSFCFVKAIRHLKRTLIHPIGLHEWELNESWKGCEFLLIPKSQMMNGWWMMRR